MRTVSFPGVMRSGRNDDHPPLLVPGWEWNCISASLLCLPWNVVEWVCLLLCYTNISATNLLQTTVHYPQGMLGKVLESDNWCRDWKMIMNGVWKKKGKAYFVVMAWHLSRDIDVSRENWSGKQVTRLKDTTISSLPNKIQENCT